MASSAMGLIGGLRVFDDHTRKSKRKTNALTTIGRHTQTAVHAGNLRTWRTTIILITGKTRKLSPMPGSRWRRVWYLWYISVIIIEKWQVIRWIKSHLPTAILNTHLWSALKYGSRIFDKIKKPLKILSHVHAILKFFLLKYADTYSESS